MIAANLIELEEVVSSNIARLGYDEESATLVVEFRSSPVRWAYPTVSPELYHRLRDAKPSIGSFFHHEIRKIFKGTRLELAS